MKRMGFGSRLAALAATAMLCSAALALPAAATGDACLLVTKECQDAMRPDGPITFSGTVTNACTYEVRNVTVKDYVGGVMIYAVQLGTLAPGASASYSGSYLPTISPSTDTVWAYGAYTDSTGSTSWLNAYASATCKVQEEQGDGCTLTPGYWKTHSILGPAPYDDTWALLGEGTPFFSSGMGYLQVLNRAPRGNAYFILAHAYIAAELNALNGASAPADVAAAFAQATSLFQMFTPAEIGALPGGSALRARFTTLGGILDDYNNGFTGPGHCTD